MQLRGLRIAAGWLAISLALIGLGTFLRATPAQETNTAFLVKPYLQMGNMPSEAKKLVLFWHTEDTDAEWRVETRSDETADWKRADKPSVRRITLPTIAPHRVYTATLSGLTPGAKFNYRVLKAGQPVFEAEAQARKTAEQPYRFVVFGDCAQGTPGQRAIAYQTWQQKPDFVFITGDIVYGRGRVSEYRERYFPVYNADDASLGLGPPLTRSTLFIAAPGNHDIENPDLETNPDALAYFTYWSQPLNGPLGRVGAPNTPLLKGPEANQKEFLKAAGYRFPKMANFSFDYGNAHWTILDSCHHANWTDAALRTWVKKDLSRAQKATWRFVAFHHPPFNSSQSHFNDQWMRLLADLFEKYRVDVVWAGHVHNYQRTYPLTFKVAPVPEGSPIVGPLGTVAGEWKLDKAFDGNISTKPDGVLYIITGGGGAGLYNPELQATPDQWQSFTCKYVADTHSLSSVDVEGKTLTLRQISEDGREVDRFTIIK